MSSRIDPTEGDIPNLGVAKVKNPEDEGDWATLEWELRSFVCEGEYERGLERILDQFLSHLSQAEQPAAWVSGFFGSGKSHLMRVLEYLWRDYKLPSGASARELADAAARHRGHLVELSIAAQARRRAVVGCRHARLGRFGVRAAGLPRRDLRRCRPAAAVRARAARDLAEDTRASTTRSHAAVERSRQVTSSTSCATSTSRPSSRNALIDAGASFGDTPAAVSTALQTQYPTVDDISNDEMLDNVRGRPPAPEHHRRASCR